MDNPGTNNFDLSVQKNSRVLEGHALQFRAQFFDAFNHPRFGNPVIFVDSQNFGRITSAGEARQIQLGLGYEF